MIEIPRRWSKLGCRFRGAVGGENPKLIAQPWNIAQESQYDWWGVRLHLFAPVKIARCRKFTYILWVNDDSRVRPGELGNENWDRSLTWNCSLKPDSTGCLGPRFSGPLPFYILESGDAVKLIAIDSHSHASSKALVVRMQSYMHVQAQLYIY